MGNSLLEVNNLDVSFKIGKKTYPALEDITFKINENTIVGVVGESGSGKSLTAQSILGILPTNTEVEGSIKLENDELINKSMKDWKKLRSNEVSLIFQEPMTSLNPLMKVGKQISEILKKHTNDSKEQRYKKTIKIMNEVGLKRSENLYHSYPHELSGGMRQRIVIAMAIINNPKLIIADEPTTALDVTIQAQILNLLKSIVKKRNGAMLFISHDWGVISQVCDYVLVMYAGQIVEQGLIENLLNNPQHPYTRGLIKAIPDFRKRGEALYSIPLRVPALTERNKGEWPYIKITKENAQCAAEIFPEITKEGTKE
ncbi:Oligopeptide transport ATP-binding protein OppD [Paraliobacillus sp. PM-2]|uniref:ABC transporter ATP-binding protein n=1 Tax=Paraliobacillus sp. PM-2 TaxID=1462524 RepID=UPI00061C1901|nr:ABC transporter ATP-binding protein [Paraliobacillus sp. PM-2]CQR46814.1 Oligopeptide transport ATP-binding protein OppD [Paraliobacillus sp. PM-2]